MTDKITIARNVLQQSLDALEASQEFTLASADGKVRHGWGNQLDDAEDAITALREALAAPQPAQDAVDAERYRWLRDRFLGTDYAWGHRGTGVWVFETDAPVSVDPGASIDAAIAAQKGKP